MTSASAALYVVVSCAASLWYHALNVVAFFMMRGAASSPKLWAKYSSLVLLYIEG